MHVGRGPGRQRSIWPVAGRHRSRRPEWRSRDRQRPWEEEGRAEQERGLQMKPRNVRRRQSYWGKAKVILSAEESRRRCGPYRWCPGEGKGNGKEEKEGWLEDGGRYPDEPRASTRSNEK